MIKITCPICGSVEGYVREETMLVWGVCGKCGTKFTGAKSTGAKFIDGLDIKEGWEKVGCWEPPKEKLNEEVIDYIKSKGARPLISGEWLSKQEKLGKTFLMLKPQVDALIEDYFEMEVKELC